MSLLIMSHSPGQVLQKEGRKAQKAHDSGAMPQQDNLGKESIQL